MAAGGRHPRPRRRLRRWPTGVGLVPIRPVQGAHALTEDITTSRCRSAVRRLMDSRDIPAFNVVLHYGSPNIGGPWAQEATG
ncbi:hypothetical protein QYE76_062010 [Lolium multiflorum]|uniref:Uncharacterized protein n=1 Tax=Lolium multiflorum TaxID=4521 RepID=A0AAD8S4F7_LOLMU|nr:hypothetical protein QYE76_062010 [Lolium multiflorum]